MAAPSQQTLSQPVTSVPPKSVWRKFTDSSVSALAQNHVNGVDDARERESVSSKEVAHEEGSSLGQSTPPSSAEESQISLPAPRAPVFRPAPLPAVNPWTARREEMERQRWVDSQNKELAPLPAERVFPKAPAPKSLAKPNGVP